MKMKIVYIAHPISGDQKGNITRILDIVKAINLGRKDIVPFAPYIVDCLCMDDSIEYQRNRGIANDIELFNRGFIDELWLFGNNISSGMIAEIEKAKEMGIPVLAKSDKTSHLISKYV